MPKRVRVGAETVEVPTVHDTVMGPAGWKHGRTPEDYAWANSFARRDAVIERVPDSGLAEAWSLRETLCLTSVVPIDMQSLEPTAGPFSDSASIVDWYEAHSTDGCAVCTGDMGGWGLLGVRVKSWGAWARWLASDATDETIKTIAQKEGPDRPAAVRSLRPTGEATVVRCEQAEDQDPHRLGRIGQVTRGHAAGRQAALQVLRDMTAGPDGGFLLWPVRADEQGRLPSFRARSVNDELEVLPDNYPVPIAGVRQGLRLRTAGRVLSRPDDSSVAWLPSWLADRFGARYRR
jgi:hypothetical protein